MKNILIPLLLVLSSTQAFAMFPYTKHLQNRIGKLSINGEATSEYCKVLREEKHDTSLGMMIETIAIISEKQSDIKKETSIQSWYADEKIHIEKSIPGSPTSVVEQTTRKEDPSSRLSFFLIDRKLVIGMNSVEITYAKETRHKLMASLMSQGRAQSIKCSFNGR